MVIKATNISDKFYKEYAFGKTISRNRFFSVAWLLVFDIIAVEFSGFLAIFIRQLLGNFYNPELYYNIFQLLLIFPLSYALKGLYPGIGITPTDELKRIFRTSTLVVFLFTVILFFTQTGVEYSRFILFIFWILNSVFAPLFRLIARRIGIVIKIWGEPVAIIGFDKDSEKIINNMLKTRLHGFLPAVIFINNNSDEKRNYYRDIPILEIDNLFNNKSLLNSLGIETTFIIANKVSREDQETFVDNEDYNIKRLIFVSDLGWAGGSAISPIDMQGVLGVEVERNLLKIYDQSIKRLIDIILVLFSSIFLMIIFSVLVILIKLDSKGPVLFSHKRIGQNGKIIKVWKFRTMVVNAEEELENYLIKHPSLRKEWEETQKLKDDPRITRVGSFLRKSSLDELPQVINVLKGEMSFVGPRPIVEDEVNFYGDVFELYKKVKPGITGLWQVSGRSNTTYTERVELDEYYIRHWSFWLDIYILIRTVYTIVKGKGAY